MISVTNPDEAIEAVNGGADIIDVKNPAEGALGASPPWITRRIIQCAGTCKVSATIGDMPNLPGTASLAALAVAQLKVDYVKIGMLGPQNVEDAKVLAGTVVRTMKEFHLGAKVVIAGYADYENQGCLDPMTLPKVAHEVNAWGVLIDIREKSSRNLFDYYTHEDVKKYVQESHRLGVKTALAGSLGKDDTQLIFHTGADIMGARRKVCKKQNNELIIDTNKVRDLVNIVKRTNTLK